LGLCEALFQESETITKISIENTLNELLVEKRRRSEFDLTRDEQMEQHVTLNEVIKDVQRKSAQEFTTLIIMYMTATLFFPRSRCIVPWYIVEQIANIQPMKRIFRAKVAGNSS